MGWLAPTYLWATKGLLFLLLAGGLLLTACGGESAPATSEPQATQAAGQGGAATEAPQVGGASAPTTVTEEDLVLPQQWWTVEVGLLLGDRVVITYTSQPKAVGGFGESGGAGRPGVIFNVNDPIGDSIYRGEQLADGGYEFVAELSGTYEITFLNPVVRNLQEVKVEYKINE